MQTRKHADTFLFTLENVVLLPRTTVFLNKKKTSFDWCPFLLRITHLCYSLTQWSFSQNIFMVQSGPNVTFSNKMTYIDILFLEIPNPEWHQNCCIGSKVTAIFLNGWILLTGGVGSGMFCACCLRSRLVQNLEDDKLWHFLKFNNFDSHIYI